MSKRYNLLIWFVLFAGISVAGELGRRGLLQRHFSLLNVLIIGIAGGFFGIVLGLMTERSKFRQVAGKEKFDVKRATKRYLKIKLLGWLVGFPLALGALLMVFLRPFNSALDIVIAGALLGFVLFYYIAFLRKRVVALYKEDISKMPGVGKFVAGPIFYEFSPKDFFLIVVLILLSIGLLIGGILVYDRITSPDKEANIPKGGAEEAQLPADETADLSAEVSTKEDWKTYRNEEYGFLFSYPSYTGPPVVTKSFPAGFEQEFGISFSNILNPQKHSEEHSFCSVYIAVYDNPSNADAQSFFRNTGKCSCWFGDDGLPLKKI